MVSNNVNKRHITLQMSRRYPSETNLSLVRQQKSVVAASSTLPPRCHLFDSSVTSATQHSPPPHLTSRRWSRSVDVSMMLPVSAATNLLCARHCEAFQTHGSCGENETNSGTEVVDYKPFLDHICLQRQWTDYTMEFLGQHMSDVPKLIPVVLTKNNPQALPTDILDQ